MNKKYIEYIIGAIITIVVSYVTSSFTIQYKLSDSDRMKLNTNFVGISKSIEQIKVQQLIEVFLLSKLIYNRGKWEDSDFTEASEMLLRIKQTSNFDALQMKASSKDGKCDSFLLFYRENKETFKKNLYLQEKIKKCVPFMEQ